MQDRVPTKPNRYAVYDDKHNFLRYEYHERADEPTQAGDPLNKNTLLKDATAAKLGLTAAAVPDDAFNVLYIGVGKYGFDLTVKYDNGVPASGMPVVGLKNIIGEQLVLDSQGKGLGISLIPNPSIKIGEGYIDINQYSATLTSKQQLTVVPTITITRKTATTYMQFTQSITGLIFSSAISGLDICCVGGGGGGGSIATGPFDGGGGGGGGYVTNLLNRMPVVGEAYSIVVGAKGIALGQLANSSYDGTDGGSSSFTGKNISVVANGGKGGKGANRYGGSGNGKGGTGGGGVNANGSPGTVYEFNDSTRTLFSGGGGGGAGRGSYAGGAPYGANGSHYTGYSIPPTEAKGFGGGGGGGINGYDSFGTDGYQGVVTLRWRFK